MRVQTTTAKWALGLLLFAAACGTQENDQTTPTAKADIVEDGQVADGGELADGVGDTTAAGDIKGVDLDANSTIEDAGTEPVDSGAADAGQADAGPPDAGEQDVPAVKVCNVGETKCAGAQLATCGVYEDGWIVSSCFPGLTCAAKDGKGMCVPVSNNLIIAFDTSGSMSSKVPGCTKGLPSWPSCNPNQGCSRMDVSKVTFTKALAKIDDQVTRMALLRFPQKLNFKKTNPSCTSGYYQGQSIISGETNPGPKGEEFVDESSKWYWQTVNETLCVPFPKDGQAKTKQQILKWMDGTESGGVVGSCASSSSITCNPAPGCSGTCCPGNQCWDSKDPEFRPTGGTPIG